ncbi:hypothetical protein BKA70DRAFT_1235368 [Coprinopsis sp. MPI-PUGE-AT-0042]|nr:hypothetical protein BKA70DRAFT_1235368 [Coprinopsis sp. MPI-PUGE-AT-0042]
MVMVTKASSSWMGYEWREACLLSDHGWGDFPMPLTRMSPLKDQCKTSGEKQPDQLWLPSASPHYWVAVAGRPFVLCADSLRITRLPQRSPPLGTFTYNLRLPSPESQLREHHPVSHEEATEEPEGEVRQAITQEVGTTWAMSSGYRNGLVNPAQELPAEPDGHLMATPVVALRDGKPPSAAVKPYSSDGATHHESHALPDRIEIRGNAFTGINYGYVAMVANDEAVM